MTVVLMEFSNGDLTEAEVFRDIDALKNWFRNDYFSETLEDNLAELFKQIDDGVYLGKLDWTEFNAVLYKNYEVIG